MLNTPVLFLIYKRPDTTARVFEQIRKAKPKQLFIVADGPKDKPGEKEACEEARKIATNVDWDCEVMTLFREENLGCGLSPSQGITWFFEHVEKGIILEDDCLPNQSFFKFCEELLDYYMHDERVWVISGFNELGSWETDASYFFSYTGKTWGWATWKRAWDKYTFDISPFEEIVDQVIKTMFHNKYERIVRRDRIQELLEGDESIWDYQWSFIRWMNNALAVVPCINLVRNIGFDHDATHTKNSDHQFTKIPTIDLINDLDHPNVVIHNHNYANTVFEKYTNVQKYQRHDLISRIIRKLQKMLSKYPT